MKRASIIQVTNIRPIKTCRSASHGSKGPPEHGTDLGQCQCVHNCHRGPPTSDSAEGEVSWWPSQVDRTRLSSIDLFLPHGASIAPPNVGFARSHLFCQPSTALTSLYNGSVQSAGCTPSWFGIMGALHFHERLRPCTSSGVPREDPTVTIFTVSCANHHRVRVPCIPIGWVQHPTRRS
jgi:hypothetical protein